MGNNGGRLGLAALVLLAATACAEEPPIVADPVPTVTGSPTVEPTGSATHEPPGGGQPSVTLVEAGIEPRRELRLQLEEGDTQTATMTMRMKMGMTVNGKETPAQDLPAMTMGLRVEVSEVSDDGTIAATFSYGDVGAEGDGKVAREMAKALAALNGLGGTMRLSPRGEYIDGDLDLPAGLPRTLAATLRSMKDQMKNFAAPLPAEAVGEGARWTVVTSGEINGIKAETHYGYELVRFTEDGAELRVTLEQEAESQSIDLPGVPRSVNAFVESFSMKGAGHSTVGFGQLLPVSSTMVASGRSRMTMWDGSTTADLVQDMEMLLRLEGR
jgi:hypothetical protein